jgi:hypothetical protein
MLADTGAHRPAVRDPHPRDLGIAGLAHLRHDVDGLGPVDLGVDLRHGRRAVAEDDADRL